MRLTVAGRRFWPDWYSWLLMITQKMSSIALPRLQAGGEMFDREGQFVVGRISVKSLRKIVAMSSRSDCSSFRRSASVLRKPSRSS